jgi:hypothetical protein
MAIYDTFKKIDAHAIVDGSILPEDIGANQITGGKIGSSQVTEAKFAEGAVAATELAANIDLSSKSITYRSIADGDISGSAAIAGSKLASGAAVGNLGYTPMNKAGDQVTNLRLATGSAGTTAIGPSGDNNTGIFYSGNDTILTVGGSEAMRTRGNNVTRERTPMFHATGTSGWRYNNSYGGYGWRELSGNFGWSAYQRGGTNFQNGNGRFYAPVSGFYQFQFQTYCRNDTNSTAGYVHFSFGKNGSVAMHGGRTPHGIWRHGGRNNYAHGLYADLGTYMNAGQYISVWIFWRNSQTRFHGAHSIFNGYLIG